MTVFFRVTYCSICCRGFNLILILGRKSLAVYIVTNILDNDTYITTPESVDSVLSMLSSLIQSQNDQTDVEDDPEDFDEEQGLLGR